MVQRMHAFLRISIHALHEESDTFSDFNDLMTKFQSTLSMRRATINIYVAKNG
ncbi:hypothetical protein B5791_0731 [Bifidobacterium pseudocatenulatum]|nr:hypothetical protein B5791_0731 [Bifidobacterium pseudocatenulatum]